MIAGSAFPAIAAAPAFFYSSAHAQSVPQTPIITAYALPTATTTPETAEVSPKPKSSGLECFCVMWLREHRGIPIHGDAYTITGNIPLAQATIGDVLLLSYDGVEHAAEITGFTATGFSIIEANFSRCRVTQREIDLSRETVRGVFRP